jgi:hypothetical protein
MKTTGKARKMLAQQGMALPEDDLTRMLSAIAATEWNKSGQFRAEPQSRSSVIQFNFCL